MVTHRAQGHVMYLRVLGQPMIVLSSQEAVRDLLDKRSSIYSDRPRFVLFSELYVASHVCPVNIRTTGHRMGWHSASTHMR